MPIYREDNSQQIMQENRLYFAKNIKSLSERQVIWVQNYLASQNVRFAHVGSTDRFRLYCINQDYASLQLNNNEKQEILKAVQSLQKWEVGKVDGKNVDSYYQITLKIEHAKVIDIF